MREGAVVYLFAPRRKSFGWERMVTIERAEFADQDGVYRSIECLLDAAVPCPKNAAPGCFIIEGTIRQVR